jgi:exosortase E/protease (VPEID-CTERM system)
VFVAVYLWLFRKRATFPQALWLFPAGLAAIWIANVLRIAALIVVGTEISPAIAAGGFHSQAGWIAFTIIALGLIALSHHLGLVVRAPATDSGSATLASALLVPLMAMLATSLVTSAFTSGTDLLYPLGVVVTAAALWNYRSSYRGMPFDLSFVPVAIGVAVFVAWLWLIPGVPVEAGTAEPAPPSLPPLVLIAWIVFRVAGSVITVPIAEELAFRGYLLRKLVSRDFENVPGNRFTLLSFVVSSILFGLLHASWIAGTVAGALFAVATYYRGRVSDAIVAHMTANALIAIAVLGFGRWDLWL